MILIQSNMNWIIKNFFTIEENMKIVRTAKGQQLNFDELVIKQSMANAPAEKPLQFRNNPGDTTMELFNRLNQSIGNTGMAITVQDAKNMIENGEVVLEDPKTKRKLGIKDIVDTSEERKVYSVDIDDMPVEEANAAVAQIADNIKNKTLTD